jgi:hypothetical protein
MLDFRDAKTMAQSLRKALAAQQLAITHSQSLELIAQAFGLADWNTLSAKIEAANAAAPRPLDREGLVYCSFCKKSQHDVMALIAGPGVNICNECVGLCDGVLLDQSLARAIKTARSADPDSNPAAAASEALQAYSDDQLADLRRTTARWLDHLAWSLKQTEERQAGRAWRPDEVAQSRGWTTDPLAGKSPAEIAAHAAHLATLEGQARERLGFVDDVMAMRGLA